MTCTESKRLMLMRKEELSREQSDKLRLHVKSCSNCAAYMQETKDVTRGMETLRSFEPVLKDPEALMSDILNAVEKARRNRADVTVGFSGRMFAFLSRRAVRVAYGMFVLGSVGMFLAQQLTVAADVQLLEDKMVQWREDGTGVQVVYTVPSNLVNRLPQSQQMRSYFEREEARERDGLFVIDVRSLSRAVDVVGSLLFRSTDLLPGDEGRRNLETLVETLQRSASVRVTILSKERS